MNLKESSTTVKYTKDGVEKSEDVKFSVQLAGNLAEAREIAVSKLTEDESKAENSAELAESKVVDYFNQVLETNARQAARASFLAAVEGPDKQILGMAKKLAAVKNISVEEAEKQIRALL